MGTQPTGGGGNAEAEPAAKPRQRLARATVARESATHLRVLLRVLLLLFRKWVSCCLFPPNEVLTAFLSIVEHMLSEDGNEVCLLFRFSLAQQDCIKLHGVGDREVGRRILFQLPNVQKTEGGGRREREQGDGKCLGDK